jgi:DNA-binding transcriptional ArsR family regulator
MTMGALARLVQTHKAIAHPVRLRLLAMLRSGPLCVCQMTVVVRLAASTVSEHLAELRRAGLVVERKDGKWVEYRLAGSVSGHKLDALWPFLEEDTEARADAILVNALRRVPVDELCRASLDLTKLARPRVAAAMKRAARLRETNGVQP